MCETYHIYTVNCQIYHNAITNPNPIEARTLIHVVDTVTATSVQPWNALRHCSAQCEILNMLVSVRYLTGQSPHIIPVYSYSYSVVHSVHLVHKAPQQHNLQQFTEFTFTTVYTQSE